MNKETLLAKREAVETKFNDAKSQQTILNEELLRLQGDYRTITDLIDSLEKPVEGEIINQGA